MPKGKEPSKQRKEAVWNAGFAGEAFPFSTREVFGEELEELKLLFEVASEAGSSPSLSLRELFASELFEPGKKIDSGGFGTVYQGKNKSTGGPLRHQGPS